MSSRHDLYVAHSNVTLMLGVDTRESIAAGEWLVPSAFFGVPVRLRRLQWAPSCVGSVVVLAVYVGHGESGEGAHPWSEGSRCRGMLLAEDLERGLDYHEEGIVDLTAAACLHEFKQTGDPLDEPPHLLDVLAGDVVRLRVRVTSPCRFMACLQGTELDPNTGEPVRPAVTLS